jgi:hypothetical protein
VRNTNLLLSSNTTLLLSKQINLDDNYNPKKIKIDNTVPGKEQGNSRRNKREINLAGVLIIFSIKPEYFF